MRVLYKSQEQSAPQAHPRTGGRVSAGPGFKGVLPLFRAGAGRSRAAREQNVHELSDENTVDVAL